MRTVSLHMSSIVSSQGGARSCSRVSRMGLRRARHALFVEQSGPGGKAFRAIRVCISCGKSSMLPRYNMMARSRDGHNMSLHCLCINARIHFFFSHEEIWMVNCRIFVSTPKECNGLHRQYGARADQQPVAPYRRTGTGACPHPIIAGGRTTHVQADVPVQPVVYTSSGVHGVPTSR